MRIFRGAHHRKSSGDFRKAGGIRFRSAAKKDAKAPVVAKKEEKKDAKKVSLVQTSDAVLKNFHTSKKIEMQLERGQDYVILQTGTAENPVLIAFPGEAQPTGFVGFFKNMYHKMFNWI